MNEVEFLVVDDDRLFRSRLVHALIDRGFSSSVGVESVAEAIDVLRQRPVQKAIVDLRMPGGEGTKVLEWIFQNNLDTRVVVLTGYGSIVTATQAMKLGAVNFLTKPVGVDRILLGFDEQRALGDEVVAPSLSQVEWEHIQRVIADCDGNITKAAKILGIHRRSLQRRLQKSPGTLF